MNQCKQKEAGLHQQLVQRSVGKMAHRATSLREQWRKVGKTHCADRSIPPEWKIMLRELVRRAEENATAMIDVGLEAFTAFHRKDYSGCMKAMDEYGQRLVENAVFDMLVSQFVNEAKENANGR